MNDLEFGDWLSARLNEPAPDEDATELAERVLRRAGNERIARLALLGGSVLLGAGAWLAVIGGQTSLDLVASGVAGALAALGPVAVPAAVVLALALTPLAAWRAATIT